MKTIGSYMEGTVDGFRFSFEVLPPLKGCGTDALFSSIEKLLPFNPAFINITNHNWEYEYRDAGEGRFERIRVRRRPGTVAIAAAIQQRYGIPVEPHVICSGRTVEEIEYELLDLQFLGIRNLMLLRGDKAVGEKSFMPTQGGHAHTTELIRQVVRFNEGCFNDGSIIKCPGAPFEFGVACYPEKHEESPNLEMDLHYLKEKQDLGASYAVAQLFYDNEKFYSFVGKAREMGITIPIVPGIKPLTRGSQLTVLPRTFHCDIPGALSSKVLQCSNDAEVRDVGIGWAVEQCEDLFAHGFHNIHFYTASSVDSVVEIARRLL